MYRRHYYIPKPNLRSNSRQVRVIATAPFPSWPVSFDRRETGGLEKFERMVTGLTDPFGGNLASGAACSHGALLSAQDSTMLPQLTPLAKFRDPSGSCQSCVA